MKLEFYRQIFKSSEISNLMKIPCVEAELFHADGRSDRYDNANSQFCESVWKCKNDDRIALVLPARQWEHGTGRRLHFWHVMKEENNSNPLIHMLTWLTPLCRWTEKCSLSQQNRNWIAPHQPHRSKVTEAKRFRMWCVISTFWLFFYYMQGYIFTFIDRNTNHNHIFFLIGPADVVI
jgi:hypothetical protein